MSIFLRVYFIVLFFIPGILSAQQDEILPGVHELDSIYHVYGNKKVFDSAMLIPSLLAISYYPELKNARIQFRHKKIPTLMAARPAPGSLLRKREKRLYLIIISTNPDNHSHTLFQNMSVSSKTGIIGHEYAHLLEYEKKSNFGLILYGIQYFFARRKIERETDMTAISRGLGNEMLEYTLHLKTSRLISRKYHKRKKKYYLSAAEIRNLVENTL